MSVTIHLFGFVCIQSFWVEPKSVPRFVELRKAQIKELNYEKILIVKVLKVQKCLFLAKASTSSLLCQYIARHYLKAFWPVLNYTGISGLQLRPKNLP